MWEGDYPGDQLTIADNVYHGYVRVRCWNIANQDPSGYSEVLELGSGLGLGLGLW